MKNPAFTRKEEMAPDKLYFYNLVKNPQALPPAGLDAVTAELIRRLVDAEQGFEVKTSSQLEPAKERVWQDIMAGTGLAPAWPPVSPEVEPESGFNASKNGYRPFQKEFFAGESQPYKPYRQPRPTKNFFEWSKLFVKAGMVVTVLIISLLLFAAVVNINNTDSALPVPVKPGAGKFITPPEPSFSKPTPNPPSKTDITKPDPPINLKGLLNQAEIDLAGSLNIDPVELQQQLKAGLTLSELAATFNKDPNVIRGTLIASIKRQLNEGVTAGKWSASQAEQANQETPAFIDQVFNNK